MTQVRVTMDFFFVYTQGKIELELQVLLIEEAEKEPAGIGRDGPNALPAPK